MTPQHIDLPLCHGTSVRPSGRFPSVWNNPEGSFVTGTPAEAKERAIRSLRAWCLADLPGAVLHTKLCSPKHPRGNRSGIDVAHRGLSQASSQLQLSPPHRLVLNRVRRLAWRTASLHCAAWKQPETKPEGVWKLYWLLPAPYPQAHQADPRKVVWFV